jgi:hypothetical protein
LVVDGFFRYLGHRRSGVAGESRLESASGSGTLPDARANATSS